LRCLVLLVFQQIKKTKLPKLEG